MDQLARAQCCQGFPVLTSNGLVLHLPLTIPGTTSFPSFLFPAPRSPCKTLLLACTYYLRAHCLSLAHCRISSKSVRSYGSTSITSIALTRYLLYSPFVGPHAWVRRSLSSTGTSPRLAVSPTSPRPVSPLPDHLCPPETFPPVINTTVRRRRKAQSGLQSTQLAVDLSSRSVHKSSIPSRSEPSLTLLHH